MCVSLYCLVEAVCPSWAPGQRRSAGKSRSRLETPHPLAPPGCVERCAPSAVVRSYSAPEGARRCIARNFEADPPRQPHRPDRLQTAVASPPPPTLSAFPVNDRRGHLPLPPDQEAIPPLTQASPRPASPSTLPARPTGHPAAVAPPPSRSTLFSSTASRPTPALGVGEADGAIVEWHAGSQRCTTPHQPSITGPPTAVTNNLFAWAAPVTRKCPRAEKNTGAVMATEGSAATYPSHRHVSPGMTAAG